MGTFFMANPAEMESPASITRGVGDELNQAIYKSIDHVEVLNKNKRQIVSQEIYDDTMMLANPKKQRRRINKVDKADVPRARTATMLPGRTEFTS